MLATGCLLLCAFAADPDAPAAPVAQAAPETEVLTEADFRTRYANVMRATARGKRPEAAVVVPEMVALYGALPDVPGLAHRQRSVFRTGLELRLTEQRRLLLRAQRTGKSSRSSRARATSLPGGGAVANNAAGLIDLITNTIAPSTWEQNGGEGTIRYWGNNPALVIRQSPGVHEQVGGALGQLRKLP